MRLITTHDRNQWRNLFAQLPDELKDIHFLPEMMLPYEVANIGRGMLLIDEDDGLMLQPLLRLRNGEIRHPYNFGGPLATPGYRQSRPAVRGPVFCTLCPFTNEAQRRLVPDAIHVKDTVWVDLTEPTKLRQTTRHLVEKAERGGAEFAQVGGDRYALLFHAMYEATMERNGAAEHWHLLPVWFRTLLNELDGNASLYAVTINGEPEAMCLLLHAFGTCYYHFAASSNHPSVPGINHFMVTRAMEEARKRGCKRFHLGGGVKPNDGLFTFKAGFSELRLPVYQAQWSNAWPTLQ